MPISRDTYRRLVLLNTAVLVTVIGLGLFAAALALESRRVRSFIAAVLDREVSRSDTVAALMNDAVTPLPEWGLRIDSKHMRQIEQLASALREAGSLTESGKRWFPAELIVEGERYDGKIRLRGDLDQHWRGAKKSWRLRLKRGKLFGGMRDIDLILPRDKGYEVEPVAYDAARDLGLIAPPSGFVRVAINSVEMGAYLWREVPGKEALEKLGLPEGELFGEQNTWIQEHFSGRGIYRIPSPPVSFHPANWQQKVFGDSDNAGRFQARWRTLLELITDADEARFDAEIDDVLDVERYFAWNALTWLFGSTHSHWGDNLSWYYDPTTGRFQPLLYDVFRYRIENLGLGTFEVEEHDDLALRLLRDPGRRLARNKVLWRLLDDRRFDLAARAADAFRDLAPHLLRGVEAPSRQELTEFQAETQSILKHNRALIQDHLTFGRLFIAPTLALDSGRPALVADLAPDALVPIALEGVRFDIEDAARLGFGQAVEARIVAPDGRQQRVASTVSVDGERVEVTFSGLSLETPVDAQLRPILGRYLLTVVFPRAAPGVWQRPVAVKKLRWRTRHALTGMPIADAYRYETVPAYGFVRSAPGVDDFPAAGEAGATPALQAVASLRARGVASRLDGDGRTVVLDAGRHRFEDDLELPRGVALRLEPGVRLAMGAGASLLIRGPVTAVGTAAAPIVVEPVSPDTVWGAFGVVEPAGPSRFSHFTVRGGSEDWVEGIYLAGQLSLYGAPTEIADSIISGAVADDGLNVKRARTTILRTTFYGNAADGFDGDFVEGLVADSCFVDNGGDGVDLSGARLTVLRSVFAGMGDKALSIGEHSTVAVVDSVVRDSLIGIASKDLSEVRIVASVLDGNRSALALYRKKPVFGGGRMAIERSLIFANDQDVTVDAESRLALRSVGLAEAIEGPGIDSEDLRIGLVAAHVRRRGFAGYAVDSSSPFDDAPALALESLPGMGSDRIVLPAGALGLTTRLERLCPPVPGSS